MRPSSVNDKCQRPAPNDPILSTIERKSRPMYVFAAWRVGTVAYVLASGNGHRCCINLDCKHYSIYICRGYPLNPNKQRCVSPGRALCRPPCRFTPYKSPRHLQPNIRASFTLLSNLGLHRNFLRVLPAPKECLSTEYASRSRVNDRCHCQRTAG